MTSINLADLPPAAREQIEREYRAAKQIDDLNRAAKEKREAEAQERKEQAEADAEARRLKQEDAVVAEIRRRYLATGATPEQFEKERGQLIAQYRQDVSLGRIPNGDDAARAAMARQALKSF
jgi:hypothetical protein